MISFIPNKLVYQSISKNFPSTTLTKFGAHNVSAHVSTDVHRDANLHLVAQPRSRTWSQKYSHTISIDV